MKCGARQTCPQKHIPNVEQYGDGFPFCCSPTDSKLLHRSSSFDNSSRRLFVSHCHVTKITVRTKSPTQTFLSGFHQYPNGISVTENLKTRNLRSKQTTTCSRHRQHGEIKGILVRHLFPRSSLSQKNFAGNRNEGGRETEGKNQKKTYLLRVVKTVGTVMGSMSVNNGGVV